MKLNKAFDAVTMKQQIQQEIADEFKDIPDDEARKIQMQQVEQNSIIGNVLRKVRRYKPLTTTK